MVTIIVGSSQREYLLHKDLLCSKSAYFRGAFENRFKEGREGVLTLPHDDTKAFEIMIGWIYGGNVPAAIDEPGLQTLLYLYVMADCYLLKLVMNDTMDRIRDYYGDDARVLGKHVAFVRDHCAAGSPLRRLLTQLVAYEICSDGSFQGEQQSGIDDVIDEDYLEMAESGGELMKELLRAFFYVAYHEVKSPATWDVEDYHVSVELTAGEE